MHAREKSVGKRPGGRDPSGRYEKVEYGNDKLEPPSRYASRHSLGKGSSVSSLREISDTQDSSIEVPDSEAVKSNVSNREAPKLTPESETSKKMPAKNVPESETPKKTRVTNIPESETPKMAPESEALKVTPESEAPRTPKASKMEVLEFEAPKVVANKPEAANLELVREDAAKVEPKKSKARRVDAPKLEATKPFASTMEVPMSEPHESEAPKCGDNHPAKRAGAVAEHAMVLKAKSTENEPSPLTAGGTSWINTKRLKQIRESKPSRPFAKIFSRSSEKQTTQTKPPMPPKPFIKEESNPEQNKTIKVISSEKAEATPTSSQTTQKTSSISLKMKGDQQGSECDSSVNSNSSWRSRLSWNRWSERKKTQRKNRASSDKKQRPNEAKMDIDERKSRSKERSGKEKERFRVLKKKRSSVREKRKSSHKETGARRSGDKAEARKNDWDERDLPRRGRKRREAEKRRSRRNAEDLEQEVAVEKETMRGEGVARAAKTQFVTVKPKIIELPKEETPQTGGSDWFSSAFRDLMELVQSEGTAAQATRSMDEVSKQDVVATVDSIVIDNMSLVRMYSKLIEEMEEEQRMKENIERVKRSRQARDSSASSPLT